MGDDGRIQVLQEDLVRKIAAGEVVEGPHSVVKELVENSIDAGATRIEIELRGAGKRLVRVVDNGRGMSSKDAVLAFERHATSKISRLEDLEDIRTLGFRGEALPAIAAVAKVTLTTKRKGARTGTKVLADGKEVSSEEAGCPDGTIVEAKDLFHSVPARKKHLRPDPREMSSVIEVVTSYALSYPAITFKLVSEGKEVFKAPAATGMRERAVAVFGLETAREMVRVEDRREDMFVEGLMTKPHVNRSKHSSLTFVNRRLVVSKVLREAITAAYGPLMPSGRHPIAVLNIIMDPKDVDVNVHPAKTEVRFVDGLKVYDIVYRAVRKALQGSVLVPEVAEGDIGTGAPFAAGRAGRPNTVRLTGKEGGVKVSVKVLRQDVLVEEEQVEDRGSGDGRDRPVAPPTERLPFELKVVGQVGNLYIVCECRDGIVIIDQHAAHEKIVYENLKEALEGDGIGIQELVQAYTFELPAKDAEDMRRHLETLASFGFGVEEFGDRTFRVRHVPSVMGTTIMPDAIRDVLSDIVETERGGGKGDERLKAMRDRVIATMACHSAVRGGRSLELEEMRSIVRELYSAKDPYACPHGRPTIVSMPFAHLERRFGRRT